MSVWMTTMAVGSRTVGQKDDNRDRAEAAREIPWEEDRVK